MLWNAFFGVLGGQFLSKMFGNLLDILMLVFIVKNFIIIVIIIIIIIIFVKDGRDSYTPFKSGFTYKYSLLNYRYVSCGF